MPLTITKRVRKSLAVIIAVIGVILAIALLYQDSSPFESLLAMMTFPIALFLAEW